MFWESQRESQRSGSISRQVVGLSFQLLWNYPRFLPSGGFRRIDIQYWSSRGLHTCCAVFATRSRIGQTQTQKPKRTRSCCLESHSLPADFHGVEKSCKKVNLWVHKACSMNSACSLWESSGPRKHLPVLSAATHPIFTRCSESDPVTNGNQNSLRLQGG